MSIPATRRSAKADLFTWPALVVFLCWTLLLAMGVVHLGFGPLFTAFLFLVGVPLAVGTVRLFDLTTGGDASATDADGDPIATVQELYARGEIDDEEFDRRLTVLLGADERATVRGSGNEEAYSLEES